MNPSDPSITLSLPLSVINATLAALSKQPIESALPAFSTIQAQTQTAVDAMNARNAASATDKQAAVAALPSGVALLPGTPV